MGAVRSDRGHASGAERAERSERTGSGAVVGRRGGVGRERPGRDAHRV